MKSKIPRATLCQTPVLKALNSASSSILAIRQTLVNAVASLDPVEAHMPMFVLHSQALKLKRPSIYLYTYNTGYQAIF